MLKYFKDIVDQFLTPWESNTMPEKAQVSIFDLTKEQKDQKKTRERLALWTYAKVFNHYTIVADHVYDANVLMYDPRIKTDCAELDKFFKEKFNPNDPNWIKLYPRMSELEDIYEAMFAMD